MRKLPDEYRKEPEMALASALTDSNIRAASLPRQRSICILGGTLVVEIGHNRAALEKAYPKIRFAWPRVTAGTGYVFTVTREQLP